MYKWNKTTLNRKYPVLFGTLLSLSAHTVIAMTIYTLRSTNMSAHKQIIDFPLVDLTWQEAQTKPLPTHTKNQRDNKSGSIKRTPSSAQKNTPLTNDIPQDLKPSVYNEMPVYPEDAKNQEIESSFRVSLILDKTGKVTRIIFPTNNEPPTLLKAEVTKKLSKWKFTSSQNLANIQINVPIQFKLDV